MSHSSGGADASWVSAFGGQLLRYVLVGATCTLLQYLALIAVVEWAHVDATLASGLTFLMTAVLNYLLNRRYTWASNAEQVPEVRRFALVLASGLALNLLGMRLLHGYLHWHYVLSQILTSMLTTLWNFMWHRYWTFATHGPARD